MGLDLNFGDFHCSYSGFMQFRTAIARVVGINLHEMQGFNGNKSWDDVKDPIKVLLNHSDCDGIIEVAFLPDLIKSLVLVLRKIEANPSIVDDHDYIITRIKEFIDSCVKAIEADSDLEFQ